MELSCKESVATCPHDKANKDDMTYIKAHQSIANILATHEAKKGEEAKTDWCKTGRRNVGNKIQTHDFKPKFQMKYRRWGFKHATFRSLFLSEAKEGQIVGAAQNVFHYLRLNLSMYHSAEMQDF